MSRQAVVANAKDNVATAVADIAAGTKVTLDVAGKTVELVVSDAVPFAHKFALTAIEAGTDVIKYGESIGQATVNIAPGQYVHIHNVESKRGRGDWDKEEKN
ncbi:UxaA family hydrolase [Zhaonella formicivorans]|uniref:UxaA family hydrolase n=1 Tax=Zhaonella formicivorans TaxID=2528593 RepID=UPI0010F02A08|nr:UxaA family hydrolase [Zhaonella formicivorans]